jgi:hypothetical protein
MFFALLERLVLALDAALECNAQRPQVAYFRE